MTPIEGREAIGSLWSEASEEVGAESIELDTIQVEGTGDTACEFGSCALIREAGSIDQGKYLVVWRRDPDGFWTWHWSIWNSDRH